MFLCSNLVSLLKLNLQRWVIQAREFEIVTLSSLASNTVGPSRFFNVVDSNLTRWLEYLFNIWPFTSMIFGQ